MEEFLKRIPEGFFDLSFGEISEGISGRFFWKTMKNFLEKILEALNKNHWETSLINGTISGKICG